MNELLDLKKIKNYRTLSQN